MNANDTEADPFFPGWEYGCVLRNSSTVMINTVLTIAAGYVQNADDAKDIYQEVFIRVYRSLSEISDAQRVLDVAFSHNDQWC